MTIRPQHSYFDDQPHKYWVTQTLEVSSDVATLVDTDGRIRYANPIAGEVMGCQPQEMTGRFLWDILNNPAHVAHIMETTLTYGQWRGEVEMNHPKEPIPLQWRSTIIQSQSGELLGTAHVGGRQISQKELLDRLATTERQRLLGELTGGVVHSLNQVFMTVQGYASLLQLEVLPETAHKNLDALLTSVEKGISFVQRIQGNRSSQKQNRLDINEVVKTCIETTKPKWQDEARYKGSTIAIHLDLQTTQKVTGTASILDEVLMNLIFNAVDAMPNGGQLTFCTGQNQNTVFISVTDTGIGMNTDTLKRVGELFFTTKPNGHGIGLATCYHLINQMNGNMIVDSTEGQGTTFTIYIPIAT